MIVSVEGGEATGKSTLLHTAPLPIVSISLDMGFDRAVYGALYDRFFKGLDIVKHRYIAGVQPDKTWYEGHDVTCFEIPAPLQFNPNAMLGYMDAWDYFMSVFVAAVQDPNVSTIGIDTMTLLTKYKRDAYLEELQKRGGAPRKQLQQIEYGHPDGQIRSIFTFAQALGKNLVVTHHLRDVYGQIMKDGKLDNGPTGALEHDGVRDIMRLVDVQLRNTLVDGRPFSTLIKCGPNLAMQGNGLANMTWDMLVDMVSMGWHGEPFQRRQEQTQGAGK